MEKTKSSKEQLRHNIVRTLNNQCFDILCTYNDDQLQQLKCFIDDIINKYNYEQHIIADLPAGIFNNQIFVTKPHILKIDDFIYMMNIDTDYTYLLYSISIDTEGNFKIWYSKVLNN